MNRTTPNQSLVFSFLLTVSSLTLCNAGATEQEIHDEHVKQALAALTKQDNEANNTTSDSTLPAVDLSKVNSSTEQSGLSFAAIKSSISRIEHEIADLKTHLKDMEETVATQAQEEKNLRARLKAELDRKTTPPATEASDDETAEDTVDDELEEDDIDIDDEDQDAVAIIAKECE